jgi:integrase
MTHVEGRKKPWETLKISRATYFRLLKDSPHSSLIEEYKRYQSEAVFERAKSQRYQKLCLYNLTKYFKVYPIVTPEGLAEFLSEVPPERYSSRKDRQSSVSSFARFLHATGRMTQEDYARIRMLFPKKSRYYRPEQRLINNQQLDAILTHAASKSELHRALIVLSETALRISEFCALKGSDLHHSDDPKRAFIVVQCGKGGKSRLIPFSKKAQEHLIVPVPKYRWLEKQVRALSKELGIPFSAHSLRHYRITQWANNPRIPITTTQRWAGHTTLTVTQGYVHINDDMALMAAFE